MIDYFNDIQIFFDRIMKLSSNFVKKYKINPNTIYVSNKVYLKFLELEQAFFRPKIDFGFSDKMVCGLRIIILGGEEDRDEIYVGIIEE